MGILLIACLSLFASTVSALSGFGLGSIMVPTLTLFLPFEQTMLFVGILHLTNNAWRVLLFKSGLYVRLLCLFGIPSLVASILGAYLIPVNGSTHLLPFLGIFLISYVVFLFFFPYFYLSSSVFNQIMGGTISGFFAGIFGIRGAIKSAFLTAYRLPKKVYAATIAAIGLMTDIARVGTYLIKGFNLSSELAWGLLICIPAIVSGVYIARYLLRFIPQHYFRPVIALFLLALGLKFVIVDGIIRW